MALTYRTSDVTRWGSGKGARLTAEEFDRNTWELSERIRSVEEALDAGLEGVGISNIEQVGSTFMIYMTNGAAYGPFTIPTAMLQWRGDWLNGQILRKLDLVTVKGMGLYLVNIPHTTPVAPATFDPDAFDSVSGSNYYTHVFGEDTYITDIAFSWPGKPGQGVEAGTDFFEHMFIRPTMIPAGFVGSRAKLQAASTSDLVMRIKKNGDHIGTVTFTAGNLIGVITMLDDADINFVDTDTLSIERPTDLDPTAARLALTIAARTVTG